jgi:hypothetical protein
MGLFGKLLGGDTVRGALQGAGDLAGDIRDAVTGEGNKARMRELEANLQRAQVELTKMEAQHASLFVAGWRPALGWCIVASIAYTYLVRPLVVGIAGIELPTVETQALWPILVGMLGLAGYRTVEKARGVQDRH